MNKRQMQQYINSKKPVVGDYIIGIGITISDPIIVGIEKVLRPPDDGATHGAFQDATPVLGDAEIVW